MHICGLVYYFSTLRSSPFYVSCYSYWNQCFVLLWAIRPLMFTNCNSPFWWWSLVINLIIFEILRSYSILYLTEMFEQPCFLRFVQLVFLSVYFTITSDHNKWKKNVFSVLIQFYSTLYFCQTYFWNKTIWVIKVGKYI
jgi:hypothetical protein